MPRMSQLAAKQMADDTKHTNTQIKQKLLQRTVFKISFGVVFSGVCSLTTHVSIDEDPPRPSILHDVAPVPRTP